MVNNLRKEEKKQLASGIPDTNQNTISLVSSFYNL